MSGREDWRAHAPVWGSALPGEEHQDQSVHACSTCDWAKQPTDNSIAAFGRHARDVGAPDYMIRYWDFWAAIVEAPTGRLDRDAVARELSDYEGVMEGASEVYSELSGLSKANTAPRYVIAGAEEKFREAHADLILHDLLSEFADEESRQLIIAFAESLHAGAWEQHQQYLQTVERLRVAAESPGTEPAPIEVGRFGSRCAGRVVAYADGRTGRCRRDPGHDGGCA